MGNLVDAGPGVNGTTRNRPRDRWDAVSLGLLVAAGLFICRLDNAQADSAAVLPVTRRGTATLVMEGY